MHMKDKVVSSPDPEPSRTSGTLQSVGQILATKKVRPAPAPAEPSSRPAVRSAFPITYRFVPYPLELADLERREAMPPACLRLLALRRLADPITGELLTSTEQVARLIGCDRSTAQKAMRIVEHQ